MADPLRITLSLAELNRQHAVFERDQVLSETQLNSVTDYLNDQDRLTRLLLLGVGVHAGLRVALNNNTIIISKGVGVATDADLLWLAADTAFTRYREYNTAAPRYDPFHEDNGTRRAISELVADGAQGEDAAEAKPLSAFPGSLGDMVVVLFMESYHYDPDLCAGNDCDNLGKDAIDKQRVLLVSQAVADALGAAPVSASQAAQALPALHADRPNLDKSVTTAVAFARPFVAACEATIKAFLGFVAQLHRQFTSLSVEVFETNPAADWQKTLNARLDKLKGGPGVLHLYDHLKDLVDTANELREALLSDDSLLCPDPAAFPKHLLLGQLNDAARNRTASYPSPLVDGGAARNEHAHFLARKLKTLIETFDPPADSALPVRVTPSRTEAAPLEARAIPIYYAVVQRNPIHQHWNYKLARRNAGASNLGYHAPSYSPAGTWRDPLSVQIARYDFFRVEGCLGRSVVDAEKSIEEIVRARNLPFLVRKVLLHTNRKSLADRPIRYTDLHRFHRLLRAEVAVHLADSTRFNDKLKKDVEVAAASKQIPERSPIPQLANAHFAAVNQAIFGVAPAMAAKTHVEYERQGEWPKSYANVVGATADFKSAVGENLRTDVATPFDGVALSNHASWLIWLDQLIGAEKGRDDDKLLFSRFIADHPAFEHLGGVPRGGTLVLLYGDNGVVVADGALPYPWPETAEGEPADEPSLEKPDLKPTRVFDKLIEIRLPFLPTFVDRFDRFTIENDMKWEKQINEKVDFEKSYFQFFQDSVKALLPIVTPRSLVGEGAGPRFADEVFGVRIAEVSRKIEQLGQLREFVTRSTVSDDQQKRALEQINTSQGELATLIVAAMRHVVDAKVDVAADTEGARGLAVLANGVGQISTTPAKNQLRESLGTVAGTTATIHKAAAANLVKLIGR